MNKLSIIVVILFLVGMGVLFYQPDVNQEPKDVPGEQLKIDFIKPPEIFIPNEDVAQNKQSTAISFTHKNSDEKNKSVKKSERKEVYEYPITEEGQAYMTRGELLLQGHKHVDTDQYSADIFKQIEQAKYNLKLSKEIATLSKKLYIDTDEGKKIDPEVYAKMNKLSMNLIIAVKKQQNIE